jgi:hypothetical protein
MYKVKSKIKQIEFKDIELDTLTSGEVFMCDLGEDILEDLYFQKISHVLEYVRSNREIVLFKVEREVDDD